MLWPRIQLYPNEKGLRFSFKIDFAQVTAAATSSKLQPRGPTVDHFLQQLGPYVSNNATNFLYQDVNCLGLVYVGN